MDNQKGTEWGFAIPMICLLIFIMPFVVIGISDYYQVNNLKDGVDKEIKRTITDIMVQKVADEISVDRLISFDYAELKKEIKNSAIQNVKKRYGLDLVIDDYDILIKIDDKVSLSYVGYVMYDPVFFNGNEKVKIVVKGRSKIQRFDR